VNNKKSYRQQKKQLNKLASFSGLALQMFTIISLGTFSGYRIDIYFEISNSIFTIIFSLISIAISLIYVIRKTKEIGN
jgi:F0F1-type ATP synthase assembly protein I